MMDWRKDSLLQWRFNAFLILTFLVQSSFQQFGANMPAPDTNPDTNSIPVFLFQTRGYSKDSSWAFYNGTLKDPLYSFTVCHRFQIYYDRPRMYIFTYAYDDKDANELYSEYHLGRKAFRICKKNTRYCAWHMEMPEFYQMRHICVSYDGAKDLFKLFVEGEKVSSGSWAGDNPVAPVRPNGACYLGQDQDNVGGGFHHKQSWSGEITQFNVWNFALEDFYIENAAECRSDLLGNIMKWKREHWALNDIKETTRPLFELCGAEDADNNKYFLFPNQFSFWFYKEWCFNQGGQIVVPQTDEKFHEIMDIAENSVDKDIHEKCVHASGSLLIWAGPVDEWEEDVWVNPYTKEPVDAGFWLTGSPNGGTLENCARTHQDRRWQDMPCDQLNCAFCYFPVRMNLSIRGLCASETKLMEGYYDLFYFISGFVNLKPHWRGLGKSHIYFRPRRQTWRLESFYDTDRYAEFFADDTNPYTYYPTGRTTWYINEGICQKKGLVPYKMSLTNCIYNDGSGYDFTCQDGTCVKMDKRCNLADDCPDGSDEEDCDILSIASDYRNELFPITASGEPLEVRVNVTILAFPEISTLDMSYLSDFLLLMRWIDPRLQFYNLVDTYELNTLSTSLQQQIWVPSFSFPNARQAEGTVVDSGCSTVVLKLGTPLPDDISRSTEALIYKGVESPIIMIREYLISFNCDFDLRMYPFDTQVCLMEFQVNGIPKRYLKIGIEAPEGCPECDGGEYLGSRTLVEYLVGSTVMEDLFNYSDTFSRARIKIMFKRQWVYHLVTVFFQSVLLIGVAYMTFYFKMSNFQDRVMIAITTMMVVATIQSSINKMVPKTSYIKMIDIWLIYSFNIIIVMMIVHTYMDMFIKRDPTDKSTQPKAINPRIRIQKHEDEEEFAERTDKIDPFGENPGWDPAWVKAYKINFLGKVVNIGVFLVFMITFWGVALGHYYGDIDIYALKPPVMA